MVHPGGPVAQLGARFHGMEEVVSSNLTRSTKFLKHLPHYHLDQPLKLGPKPNSFATVAVVAMGFVSRCSLYRETETTRVFPIHAESPIAPTGSGNSASNGTGPVGTARLGRTS